jgi:hypothetical protein
MKVLLLNCYLLVSYFGISQYEPIEHVKIEKDTLSVLNCFPHIANFYEGEIPIGILFSATGIEVNEMYRVISFSMSHQNKIVNIRGNYIPKNILQEIYKTTLGEMIFFTNIVALNVKDEIVHIVPMTLIPIK